MATRPSKSSVALAEDLYRLLARSRRALWATAARTLTARGGSVFAWQVLASIDRHGPQTQKELAASIAQHPAGLSRLLDELEEEKFIARSPDAADKRKLLVSATAKGKARFKEETPHVMASVDDALAGLSKAERQELKGLLERLLVVAEPLV